MTDKRATSLARARDWNAPTDWETVCRRASWRRYYNAWRQFRRAYRQSQIAEMMFRLDLSPVQRGTCSTLAAAFGVHRSTISRDIRDMLARVKPGRPCPWCACEARHILREAGE